MFGSFGRRHPNLEFALLVLFIAVVGGFGLAAFRYAIEIATKEAASVGGLFHLALSGQTDRP